MTLSADPRESTSAPATRSAAPFDPVLPIRRLIDTAHSKLPLYFEANQGQTDPSVKFLARGTGYTLFLTANGAVVTLRGSREAVVRMRLVGANASPHVKGSDQLLGKVNYFKGADPEQHLSEVPTFARVKYSAVYPGVDLIYYGNERRLEYDFVVASGTDPTAIKLAFEGAENLEIDSQGDLIIRSTGGELSLRKPLVYQEVAGARREIASAYVLEAESKSDHRTVGFRIGSYDHARPLVIDPVLIYSTYLGGSGDEGEDSTAPNYKGGDIAVDAGNMYVAGTTTSTDFPTTPGVDRTRSGNHDAFVTKFDAAGNLIYSTYFGGACSDRGNAVAVDSDGNAYLTGRAHENCPSDGAFVAKLGATGARLYFFTFGGEYDLSEGLDIALHETVVAGQKRVYAYVVGKTNATDFPRTDRVFQSDYGGGRWDAFVAKINPQGTDFVYSSFLGGNDAESGNSIAVDAFGNAYVTGDTNSRNFPTRNALQPEHGLVGTAGPTAFVAKLRPDGSDLVYSTYLGGWYLSVAEGIAVDTARNAYITGRTTASNFVTTPGVMQPDFGVNLCYGDQNCYRAFIVKLNASGSARVYSTFLYGFGNTGGNAIAVDANDNAYVTGWVQSDYFPIVKAFQSSKRGVSDAFVAKLNADATRLVYSSYLGGNPMGDGGRLADKDEGVGIALDALGNAYVAGYTKSADFPTTDDAFQPYGGGMCGPAGLQGPCYDTFVTKISASGAGIVPPINLRALPADVRVGGTLTATWAGIPVPTQRDVLRLYTLAAFSGHDDYWVPAWKTAGASSGTLSLPLPPTLKPGWYELRLLSPDTSGFLSVIARSEPIKIASASAPAPTLTALTLNPTAVTPGTPSIATVTLSAAAPAGGISLTLRSRNSAVATVQPTVSVAAGASSATFTVTTKPVVAKAALTISATTAGVTKTAVLTVNPAPTYTLTVTKAGTGSGTVSSTAAAVR